MHTVFLALGSNLADRQINLQEALNRLRAGGKLQVRQISKLYETAPIGYTDQAAFLNMALLAHTELEPLELLDYLKKVEASLGRVATVLNGPRIIDLDIIFYDELVLDHERLQIPHPRLRGRGFVLAPLAELTSDYKHPVLNKTVSELLAEVDLVEAKVVLFPSELKIPLPCFLFITGRLAWDSLNQLLTELAGKLGFEFELKTLEVDIAAFMTCRFIADKLTVSEIQQQSLDLLIIPGFAGGDISLIEKATGVKTIRGTTDLHNLEMFLAILVSSQADGQPHYYSEAQLRGMQSMLSDANVRIYADDTRIYAFNNAVFGMAIPNERELRRLFRLFGISDAGHAYYLGREFHKATMCIKLGQPYQQDQEIV